MWFFRIFVIMKTQKPYKYIVIDTWNGEGYSYQNGAELEYFQSKRKAKAFCKKMAEAQLPEPKDSRASTEVVEEIDNGYSYLINQSGGIDDYGSYQYFELTPDIFAIKISTNVNEVELLNGKEWESDFQDCIHKIMTFIIGSKDNKISFDLSDYIKEKFFSADELGGDYDIQFRIIDNPLNNN